MLGRPLNINQMYKYFYTNILSYKRTILGGGSTTFQLFIFKDHPTIHYSKDTQKFYDDNGVMLVPKKMNPPNCSELRPIEKYWAIIKKKLKLSGKTVKSATDLKKK